MPSVPTCNEATFLTVYYSTQSVSGCWKSAKPLRALPNEMLASQPDIPWPQIARMRDHLAHRYFDTDHVIVRATVDNDLPELEPAVQALIENLPADAQQGEEPPTQAPNADDQGNRPP